MSDGTPDILEYFRLRPTRAAKVSEISEATASSATPPEERVNFHIGNPVQERRLASAYLRAILGLDIRAEELTIDDPDAILDALDWSTEDRPTLDLFIQLVRQSAPYLPRGGFSRTAPPPPVLAFVDWLQHQAEPLSYDLGRTTGRREIILASGGIIEALRVFLHALSGYLVCRPAHVFFWNLGLPTHLASFDGVDCEPLPDSETLALQMLREHTGRHPSRPTFVVLGSISSEEMRRGLRTLSLHTPLFFVEANDAPNNLSLAREAKLVDRVIRFLTPGILRPRLRSFPLLFVAGNADYLSLIETMHFQLKGTPSASESVLLGHLLATVPDNAAAEHRRDLPIEPPTEPAGFRPAGEAVLSSIVRRSESRIERLAHAAADRAQHVLQAVNARLEARLASVQRSRFLGSQATLLPVEPHALTTAILQSIDDRHVIDSLRDTYNAAFAGHHPEYERECCVVVSGSSRTALGLLGFHCGIREVVIPDLSWTYEHCFPSVHAVPLTPVFGLNIEAIMQMVESRLTADPNWREQSAVVLNNPHNATGRVFNPADVRRLLHWLLERNVWVIDDLSYHQVAPVDALPEIPTLRQHANELVAAGRITSAQSARLISVHSMSKTDCLAGARLSVVEIRDAALRERFCVLNDTIIPNIGALLLTTLFYRNGLNVARAYWRLRNSIFADRMEAIGDALRQLPPDRNMFAIDILPPAGSMYPLMHINRLPAGLSLDWIAAGLARQGIGMIPLSTFARTEQGFETGRKAFRLTLGGTDGADVLRSKTRRVLIDLNRLIAEEEAHYRKRRFLVRTSLASDAEVERRWRTIEERLTQATLSALLRVPLFSRIEVNAEHRRRFLERYLPQRLETFKQRAIDQDHLAREWMLAARGDRARGLIKTLEQEFYKDDLRRREDTFQHRLFDRTVHPTQMYSLQAETAMNGLLAAIQRADSPRNAAVEEAARMLVREYFGLDVAITSGDEAQEVILDIDAQIQAELFAELQGANFAPSFLSFWGDWDGSNRPSGQGHRLVASVLIENVRRMSRFLVDLSARDEVVRIEPGLRAELERLPYNTRRFLILLNEITTLTHQLERRYRGVLPYQFDAGRMRRIATRLKVVRDPVTSLWHHNDRLERRMLELRRKRIEAMEYYFALNKRVRKSLHQWIPRLAEHTTDDPLLREAVTTRDLLKRFVLTPRIHQNMVTAQDPFAIDTTVFNINEINAVAARFGNPGMVLALQLSMSTKPDALIALDRKMRARREQILRDQPDATLPSIRLVPLFEDSGSVRDLGSYLEKVWEYALQSRRMDQRTNERFAEVISEVFIAGSDLSQQVGQAPGAQLYREAKLQLHLWLAKRHLADSVRLKMGSGEPMQRQGGYYSDVCGTPAFVQTEDAQKRFHSHLRASTRTSTRYATTPMLGVFAGGDLRTLQSAIAERMRFLSAHDHAQLLFHLADAQRRHHRDLVRAAEEIGESRIHASHRGEQALERLTVGTRDVAYEQFLPILTENFRRILYGREEDVVGIHLISYFIARTTPPLRDRPTVRPSQGGKEPGSRILERIAATIPFARYGSLLRAIAHNQAQTVVLGVNQLTTGLFRALDDFARQPIVEGDAETYIADRILPHLPVYEILQTLRFYHDPGQPFLKRMERALPAGNSALAALREDADAMGTYLPLFRQELLRRHGIDVSDFFEGNRFVPQLLPTLRPDLAVLMQEDLFNTEEEMLRQSIGTGVDVAWMKEVAALLRIPAEIRRWRERAWSLLERPVFQRVESFVELAVSLHSLSQKADVVGRSTIPKDLRLPSGLASFFRTARADDEMRQFLVAAVEYLSAASEGMVEVPANIIKAMKGVERIARIEEQALNPADQDRLRFYLLNIARLTGENG